MAHHTSLRFKERPRWAVFLCISVLVWGSEEWKLSSCETKIINGNWLTNGELETCLLKLAPANVQEMETDAKRPLNIKIIRKLLSIEEGKTKSLLERSVKSHPVLVLAPELAFGSQDYDELAHLITGYPAKIIFISGFGFTSGHNLNQLSQSSKINPVWNGELNSDARYNCGWVWVKDGENNISCYVFLKNFPEQTHEIAIPNMEFGEKILRLEMGDLILFPLICADIISSQPNSPRVAIKASLESSHPAMRKVVITGSLFDPKSYSNWWKGPIGEILNNNFDVRLLLCNCYVPTPVKEEGDDKWRCLSGGFQKLTTSTKSPEKPLPFVRYVKDTEFCGFILRCSEVGCAFGPIRWTNDPASGRYVWAPAFRYIFSCEEFILQNGHCAADELCRFIHRFKGMVYENALYSEAAKILANANIARIIEDLSPTSSSSLRSSADELFTRCLLGVQHGKEKIDIEKLYDESTVLDCALTTLLLINESINSTLMPEGKTLEYGQLLLYHLSLLRADNYFSFLRSHRVISCLLLK